MTQPNINIDKLTEQVADRLSDQRQIGDKILVSRREAIALATGTISLGALGIGATGTAQAATGGTIGTSSNRVDIYAGDIDSNSLTVDQTLDLVQDGDLDLSGNNLTNVNALEAGTISNEWPDGSLGSLTPLDYHAGSEPTVSFSALPDYDEYKVEYAIQNSTGSGSVELQINNISDAVYDYYLVDGTETVDDTKFVFNNWEGGNVVASGSMKFMNGGLSGSFKPTISHSGGGSVFNEAVLTTGWLDSDISSLDSLDFTSSGVSGYARIAVFGYDYPE